MCAGLSSRLILCPNKIRGGYSRAPRQRVLGGEVGAGWGIFSGGAASIGSSWSAWLGADVGRELSVGSGKRHGNASISRAVPLMGRWRGAISARQRGRGVAPLRVARPSGHPVAHGGSEIWKVFRPIAGLNQYLASAQAAKFNLPENGSGCGKIARKAGIKRVGVRLISAVEARFSSISGLSRPGMEVATLGRGGGHVN